MNSNKNLSAMLNQAISALQCAVTEINRNECQCQAEKRARKAAAQKQQRWCKCAEEFGPVFPPLMPEVTPCTRPLPPRDSFGRFTSTPCSCAPAPKQPWGVTGFPPEDKNKTFGIKIMVDEPKASSYKPWEREKFLRDHAKFDRLVDAAEACTWGTKATESTTLHKCNAIRKDVCDGPVFGVNLIGESDFWG